MFKHLKSVRLFGFHLLALCGAAWLTSCVEIGRGFQSAGVADLEIGVTTREHVIQLFGPPFESLKPAGLPGVHFGDEKTDTIWRYVDSQADILHGATRLLETEFNHAGLLVDYHFVSDFRQDKTPAVATNANFDLVGARNRIILGKTSQAEVRSLLGDNHIVLPCKKPGITQRWHYAYSEPAVSEVVTFFAPTAPKTHAKWLDVDFDGKGTVRHLAGRSDFSGDAVRR